MPERQKVYQPAKAELVSPQLRVSRPWRPSHLSKLHRGTPWTVSVVHLVCVCVSPLLLVRGTNQKTFPLPTANHLPRLSALHGFSWLAAVDEHYSHIHTQVTISVSQLGFCRLQQPSNHPYVTKCHHITKTSKAIRGTVHGGSFQRMFSFFGGVFSFIKRTLCWLVHICCMCFFFGKGCTWFSAIRI